MKKKDIDLYLKRNDIQIEGNVATWNIGGTSGLIMGTYFGVFKFKCYLTPMERIAAGREYRELLGGNPTLAMKLEDDLAFNLSQLKYRIISAPPFWNNGEIPDHEVIDKITDAAMSAELKYRALLEQNRTEVLKKAKASAEALLERKEGKGETDDEDEDV